ncbi:MAG: hypothetical protein UU98_C0036G0007, partial [Parcubacteria group bacterium GW2011_GWD2_42_14]
VVVLNLKDTTYTNHISVDKEITPPGTALQNLFNKKQKLLVREQGERAVITLTLPPHTLGIFKSMH